MIGFLTGNNVFLEDAFRGRFYNSHDIHAKRAIEESGRLARDELCVLHSTSWSCRGFIPDAIEK